LRPEIFRPAAFIFMLNSTPSTGSTWFFFYTGLCRAPAVCSHVFLACTCM
jgi:hypothetical protein